MIFAYLCGLKAAMMLMLGITGVNSVLLSLLIASLHPILNNDSIAW
jgi:hypothetical protein